MQIASSSFKARCSRVVFFLSSPSKKTATLPSTTQSPCFQPCSVVQPRSLSGAIVIRFESPRGGEGVQRPCCDVNRRQLTSDPRRSLPRSKRFLRVIISSALGIRAISTLDGEPMNSLELFQRATLVTSTFLLRIVSREKGIR